MVSKNIQDKSGKASTSVQKKGKVATEVEDVAGPNDEGLGFTQPTANVGVSASYTKPIGNYENVKVGISLNLPCYVEDIDETHEFASNWVSEKMDIEVGKINQMLEE